MEQIYYTEATEKNSNILATYRIAFLTELTGPQPTAAIATLWDCLENYFRVAIADKTYIGLLAKIGDNIVGTAGMTIRVQPGSFKNPSGKTGYILNMYTVPNCRRMGISSALLKMLIAKGEKMGVGGFELHATKEGEPVYLKAGFAMHHEPTYRKFDFEMPG